MSIRPCPFCGFDDPYFDERLSPEETFIFLVCLECGAEGPVAADTASAAELWNRRTV